MNDASGLYLDLMERCLTDLLYDDVDQRIRTEGLDWPARAHTMIGLKRLANIRTCVEDVLAKKVPGDLCEAGAWRGGAAIYMRAILEGNGDATRRVWVADSFRGLPLPDPARYPQDAGDQHHTHQELAVSLEQVKANFARYRLLDDRVRFLSGWFRDTLPSAPIDRLAVLRIDADMYESTIQVLEALYDRVSPGGYVIVDDYGGIKQCRDAVHDFRTARGIHAPIKPIDWTGVYWLLPGAPASGSSAEGAATP